MPYKYMKLRSLLFRNNAERNCRPLTEEELKRGLKFHAKYIGSLEITRPVSRVEIVAAMRRVRFEFRVKKTKKKKVLLNVSVEGVQVNLTNGKKTLISHHPISKIFYVSHDSQDLKIFSYITSNETSKIFRCNVFKAHKMSHAVQVVKTIGRAFDVCHKLSVDSNRQNCEALENVESLPQPEEIEHMVHEVSQPLTSSISSINQTAQQFRTTLDSTEKYKIVNSVTLPDTRSLVHGGVFQAESWIRLRRLIDEQKEQNDTILVQMQMIQNQLEAERSSRIDAEAQMQDLIRENQNLLFRIHSMMRQLLLKEEFEAGAPGDATARDHVPDSSSRNNASGVDSFHQSPDSGHDDTTSSTRSHFRNTWCSSGYRFQVADGSCCHDDGDCSHTRGIEDGQVIENSFNEGHRPTVSPLFKDSLGGSMNHFSNRLSVIS